MECSNTEQDPSTSTSKEIDSPVIVMIKEEVIDDSNELMENVTVKIEPLTENDYLLEVKDDIEIKVDPDALQTDVKPQKLDKKDNKELIKKKKNIVKKNVLLIPKNPEHDEPVKAEKDDFTDEYINLNIVQVNITEEQRLDEHRLNLAKKYHYRFKCEPCACGFVAQKAYDKHMVLHSPESGDFQCSICFIHLRTPLLHYQHRLRHFRRYKCGLCTDVVPIKEKESVASHIRVEHMRLGFSCRICNKMFRRSSYLKLHEDQIHKKATELPCPVCGRVYYQKANLRIHVRTHDGDVKMRKDKFICDVCKASFALKQSLGRHILTKHTVNEPVCCELCNKWYKSQFVLSKHKSRDHRNVLVNKQWCDICQKFFTSPALFRHHNRRMHIEEGKRLECDYCKKRFMTKGEIRDHIMNAHLSFRNKKCPECGKGFTTNYLLKRHKLIHSGRKFPCTSCTKSFCSPSYVEFHFKLKHLNMTRAEIRTQKKNVNQDPNAFNASTILYCDTCNDRFTHRRSLIRHIESAHTLQEPVSCDICHKWYKSNDVLGRHKRRDHSKAASSERELCQFCQKYFTSPELLRYHVKRMHMKDGKRFECDYCKKRFMTKVEIRDHIMSSHLAMKHKLCNECGKGFPTQFQLNRHEKIHAGRKFPCAHCNSTFHKSSYVDIHYKLKHLNMTREEIKSEKELRLQSMVKDFGEISHVIVTKYHDIPSEAPGYPNEILGN